jgi:hypothetical protein
MVNRRRSLTSLILLSLLACGTTYRPLRLSPTPLVDKHQVVTFRVRDSLVQLHAVAFTPDSVLGIPIEQAAGCASCRVGFGVGEISEPRVSSSSMSTPVVITALVAFGVVAYYLVTHKRCNPVCPPS